MLTRVNVRAAILAVAAIAALAAPSAARAAGYQVGTAVRSINPTTEEIGRGDVYLGGYGFAANPITGGRAATGILGEGASVRAFAISDGTQDGGFAIANMEMQGWFVATKDGPWGIVDMRRAVERRTDGSLKAHQVVIQSDHSHSAPDPMGVWGGIPLSYRKRIFERTVDAVVAAWKGRRAAARVVYGAVDGRDLLSNQFDWDEGNQPVDSEVRVLQARAADGKAIATLLNFSAHATVLGSSNTKVSGDWVQRANPMLERELGGGAVTMVGTLGRTQPADRGCPNPLVLDPDKRALCTLDDYARKVVDRAKQALAAAKPLAGDPVVAARSYLIQDPATNAMLLGLLAAGDPIGAPLTRSLTPPWLTGNILGTVTGSARIGDVLVSAVPGEIYPQIAQGVRDAVGPRMRGFMTAGLAGDQLGYIIGETPDAYPGPICATFFDDCADHPPTTPGALPNDNYFFNVSHTMGERVICSLLRGAGELLDVDLRGGRPRCGAFVNDAVLPAGADTGSPAEPLTDLLGNATITGDGSDGEVKAGVAAVDATWHVGASAGQYASTKQEWDPRGEIDPSVMQAKNLPSYGVQSRLSARAIVIEGGDGRRYAIVKNDLYIPQDLLWRRTAQLLEERGTSGITKETLTMAVSHNHSSPYYSSTAWGAWAFQDVFDIRFWNYYAERMAEAIERAVDDLEPVSVGASVGSLDKPHRHSFGPAIADDGTPAGYPQADADHDMTVIRFDAADDGTPKAILVNWALHPEFLEGNDLISADYLGPLERMVDRATGATLVYTQGAVGTAEPERSTYHSIHERLEFSHKDYAQAEYGARLIADEVIDTFNDVAGGTPEHPDRYVPPTETMPVAMVDRWYPGPLSHPYPGVSSCRTDKALAGNPQVPVVGLPDCQGLGLPPNPADPGVSTDTLQAAGIPVPENYSAPSYTGLEEDVSVHLQALRLGEILLTMCSCEQWADQSRNIKTRANRTQGDQYLGFDWSEQCEPAGSGTLSCPNPHNPAQRLSVPTSNYERFRAQVLNDATGWDFMENAPYAESEPTDPAEIAGNFTHEELAPELGYTVVVPMGMTNDYNGYIASYREYQRGDHYRKALTGWGAHSMDYMATRLVQLAGHLKQRDGAVLPSEPQRELADAMGRAKTDIDMAHNDARTLALGRLAEGAVAAYEAALPDDGGEPAVLVQPEDVERFGAAFLRWRGGSNFTDDPAVRVQREDVGEWVDYADMSGELPVTLKFPRADGDLPAYATGSYEWEWTATFEAFVSSFDTGERPRATPAGRYRFVVDGRRRAGRSVQPYHLESEPFEVRPFDGITAEDVRVETDRTISLRVGPRREIAVSGDPALTDVIGPIDYPDSYGGDLRARFIREQRTSLRDPSDRANPDLVEWFCLTCTFRPWIDSGDAETVEVTITRVGGATARVPAVRQGDRWRTAAKLRPGESARVAAGGIRDPWGNLNGLPSETVLLPPPLGGDG